MMLYEILFSEVAKWKKEGFLPEDELKKMKLLVDQYSSNMVPLYYIHFSDIPKLGINPQYNYGFTPHGIYGYPLVSSIFDRLESGGLLFGSGRPYIVVFKVRNPDRVISSKSYTQQQYAEDAFKILGKLYPSDPATSPFKHLWSLVKGTVPVDQKNLKNYQNHSRISQPIFQTTKTISMLDI